MKRLVFGFAMMVLLFTACSSNNTQPGEAATKADDTLVLTQTIDTAAGKTVSVSEVVTAYLQLKNALVSDNGKNAATAAKNITVSMQKIDPVSATVEQKKVYNDIKDDIMEHAEHISTNGDKVAHQREHFDLLSADMYDLVKIFNAGQTLYQDHCPMYNDGKGANWLSESKEIKNPYLGKKMPNCGTIKEELK